MAACLHTRSLRRRSTIMRFSARSFADESRAAASCASFAGSADLGAVPCACRNSAQTDSDAGTSAMLRGSSVLVRGRPPTLMGRASSVRPRPPRRKRSGEEQQICRQGMQRRGLGQARTDASMTQRTKGQPQHHLRPAGAERQPCAIGRRIQLPQRLIACPGLPLGWTREARRQAELVAFAISKRL
jgi:hypothetical protein